MTFTTIGRCSRTGMLGIATATGSLAVGVRVPFVEARLGAVAIMSKSDHRLGTMGLKLLRLGYKAPSTVEQLVAADPFSDYRQFGIIDDDGHVSVHTGKLNGDWCGHRVGENYIALGNNISGEQVVDAMEKEFLAAPEEELEERLMRCLEAGRDAGGQPNGQRSAALVVYDTKTFPRVDLRVDVHDAPEAELRRVFNVFRPAIPYYTTRQVDPRVPNLDDWLAEHAT